MKKYFLGLKMKKNQGVPLRFFLQFLAQKFSLNSRVITVETYRGILKVIENVFYCFVI